MAAFASHYISQVWQVMAGVIEWKYTTLEIDMPDLTAVINNPSLLSGRFHPT